MPFFLVSFQWFNQVGDHTDDVVVASTGSSCDNGKLASLMHMEAFCTSALMDKLHLAGRFAVER
jgi:hypothetical protein